MNSNQRRRTSHLGYIIVDVQIMSYNGSISPVWLNPTLWSCHSFAHDHSITLERCTYLVALIWLPPHREGGYSSEYPETSFFCAACSQSDNNGKHTFTWELSENRMLFPLHQSPGIYPSDSWILLYRPNLPHSGPHFNKHTSHMGKVYSIIPVMRQVVDNTCLCNLKQTARSFIAKSLNAKQIQHERALRG